MAEALPWFARGVKKRYESNTYADPKEFGGVTCAVLCVRPVLTVSRVLIFSRVCLLVFGMPSGCEDRRAVQLWLTI